MDRIIKTKGTWSHWRVALQVTKQAQKYSFICYMLSDRVWWCHLKQFLRYSKNYISKFMQANWWHHKLFHFHSSFWIWKLSRGVGLAFHDTKVWSHHRIRIPAVIKETSFLKSAFRSNSQSSYWKIPKYWRCSTKFDTVLNHMQWVH